jgi:hypothetical protein
MRASEAERSMVEGASLHRHRVCGRPPPPPSAVPLPRAKTRGGGVYRSDHVGSFGTVALIEGRLEKASYHFASLGWPWRQSSAAKRKSR